MYFYDTSALLKLGDSVLDSNFMISYDTITELENITTNGKILVENRNRAKKILSILNKNRNKYQIVKYYSDFNECFADKSKIVPYTYRQYVIKNKCKDLVFVTNKLSIVEYVTNELQLPVLNTNVTSISDIDNYMGWREIDANSGGNEIVASYFESREPNYRFERSPYINEYLIVKDGDEAIEEMKWDGTKFNPIVYTDIKSEYNGKVRPLNVQQKLAFDLLQDDSITTKLLLGVYGSGWKVCNACEAND